MTIGRLLYSFFLSLFLFSVSYSQDNVKIYGRVTDEENYPIMLVNVSVKGEKIGTVTDKYGNYEFLIPNKACQIVFSFIGYDNKIIDINPTDYITSEIKFDEQLYTSHKDIDEVSVQSRFESTSSFTRIDAKYLETLPNTTGGIETMIKTLPGVVSTNELSSQYSVRGGNFDENLVYVNGIEIYRPLLVQSGQQEGLSFINSDLVSSIQFSAGGFDAQYSDKMSSVLDIKYKKPTLNAGSAMASLLGGTAHLEGASKNKKFTHISGIRYKSNQYLLNSLETKGEYKPNFTDFQTYLTYKLNYAVELGFLGNISNNTYKFIPEKIKNSFGTFNNPLSLNIYYDGQELDNFITNFGAFIIDVKPYTELDLKFTISSFNTTEQITYDIQGQYFINLVDKSNEKLGDSSLNIGVGTFLDHARNYLDARVISISHQGSYNFTNRKLMWGMRYNKEVIADEINEWRLVDSAGYSTPYYEWDVPEKYRTVVPLERSLNTNINLSSQRFSGFVQNIYTFDLDNSSIDFTLGFRASYWSYNNEPDFSPRGSISFDPDWRRDFIFRFASGLYYQTPFFKELRDPEGVIVEDIKSQRSIHYVLSSDYVFQLKNRPFKWVTDIYYKKLDNLIPYKVDNVQIRYSGKNNAMGYARGIDTKINGEFVRGAESWLSLSVMETKEDIKDDYYFLNDTIKIEPGYYRRPTDQRVSVNVFFQDYLPNNPDYKVHVNLIYGSKLPFSSIYSKRYDEGVQATLKAYKRVDLGFSKVLKRESKMTDNKLFNNFKTVWLGVEVFNLLGIENEVSLNWIKTLTDRSVGIKEFIVPNHLTGRLFNVKLTAKF